MNVYDKIPRNILLILVKNKKEMSITSIFAEMVKNGIASSGSYAGVHKAILMLEKRNIVIRKKKGREVLISLTSKGREVSELMKKIGDDVGV